MNMKKMMLLILISTQTQIGRGQINDGLVNLGKTYRQFTFRNNPPESVLNSLNRYDNTELSFVAAFVKETVTPKSNVLADKYLKRPSDRDLRLIYIVRNINYNIRKENQMDNNELIKDLMKKDITGNELVDTYYSMVFSAYGNKVQPFDLRNMDFQINNYDLRDDTEKGIFFLESMRYSGLQIFGYMNIVKPPNYSKALEMINKYPKFNGSLYYQFFDLNFPDFKMNIESETKKQSYKEYYIDKYYDVLLSHLDCLRQTGDNEKINNLILGSILKEQIYFKYSKREKEIRKLLTTYKK